MQGQHIVADEVRELFHLRRVFEPEALREHAHNRDEKTASALSAPQDFFTKKKVMYVSG